MGYTKFLALNFCGDSRVEMLNKNRSNQLFYSKFQNFFLAEAERKHKLGFSF